MTIEVKVPILPESVADAVIAVWHKKVGEAVQRDENLLDLETDKVVLEVPAPVDGVLKEIRFEEGATVLSQQVLALIEEGAVASAVSSAAKESKQVASEKTSAPTVSGRKPAEKSSAISPALADLPPGARFEAALQGVDPSEVVGTGRRGAVTKEDVVQYVRERSAGTGAVSARHEERVSMTRIRKRIAERMMESKNSIAMLTSFNEINLSQIVSMRRELGESFQKEHGIKLGFMSFFAKATAFALQKHPILNASVDGEDILYHSYVDLSIAISTERGLVTPVLRNVEGMSFAEIEKGIASYAQKARDGKLTLEDLQGGTFTITNGGVFGSLLSTPIVNPPQSAILGMHAIKERPIAENGQIVIAPMMYVAVSYDHRIIDGESAVRFLVEIKDHLENPDRILLGV